MSINEKMTDIANAIRSKTGKTGSLTLDDMATEINGIETEPTLQSKTVSPSTSSQTVTPDGGYDGLSQVTVAAIPRSYVKPTTTKTATTYTPTTYNQTIAAGTYCSGVQTIKGDANLIAENIAEGVSIFGVTGTHSSGGSLETCTVTIRTTSSAYRPTNIAYTSVDTNGNIIGVSQTVSNANSTTITCVINSVFVVQYKYLAQNITSNVSMLFAHDNCGIYKLDNNATTADIFNSNSGGGFA